MEGKPGFVRLPYKKLFAKYFSKNIPRTQHMPRNYNPYDPEARYISPLAFKSTTQTMVQPQYDILKNIQETFAFLQRYKINYNVENTETTAEVSIDFDGYFYNSMDHVPSIHLQFWPYQAIAWINRSRHWPPKSTIQSIVDKGCHLVPRSSPGGDVHSEWRLSFSMPEKALARLRNQEQQRAYYFFKMLFYRYLKSVETSQTDKKPLFSYIMKTTMLWACEEYSPEDPVWTSLEVGVDILLFKLVEGLKSGHVPHYFIPEINLLERIGKDVREMSVKIIEVLQKNTLMAVPSFDFLLQFAFEVFATLEQVSEFIPFFERRDSMLPILLRIYMKIPQGYRNDT